MGKYGKRLGVCLLVAAVAWGGAALSDRQQLRQELIRLHVIANSDSPEDQMLKLQVRDAVLESFRLEMENLRDMEQAKAYLQEKLPLIEAAANETLQRLGSGDSAVVSLCREAFETRHYDTFSLPAGVYEALKITIGEGLGKNWWCVVYPALCLATQPDAVAHIAAGAGFSDTLSDTLTKPQVYEIRFALLDGLGRLENMLLSG